MEHPLKGTPPLVTLSLLKRDQLLDLIVQYGNKKHLEGNRAGRFATRQERAAKAEGDRLMWQIKALLGVRE